MYPCKVYTKYNYLKNKFLVLRKTVSVLYYSLTIQGLDWVFSINFSKTLILFLNNLVSDPT